jgi:hypothetical protein
MNIVYGYCNVMVTKVIMKRDLAKSTIKGGMLLSNGF